MAPPIITKPKGFAPVNQLPSAQKVLEGQSLALRGLRVSDADAGDSTISVTLSVGHGSLQLLSPETLVSTSLSVTYSDDKSQVTIAGSQSQINAALGTLTYTPTASYNGPDTLTITSSDSGNTSGTEQTDTDKLTITVLPVNDAPETTSLSFITQEDTALVLKAADFLFKDIEGNALAAVKIVSLPTNGTLLYKGVAISASKVAAGFEVSAKDLTAGKLSFVPDTNAKGKDYASFQFQIRDNGGTANGGKDTSQVETVTISVAAVNDGPVAGNDSAFASIVRPATGFVLSNDTDAENDSLRVTDVGAGAEAAKQKLLQVEEGSTGTSVEGKYGVLTINADGSYAYTVNPDDPDYIKLRGGSATENFTYQISDGNGGSDKATLAIKVTAPNQGPVALDDNIIVNSRTISAKALTNDTDKDGDRLVVTRVDAGTKASNAAHDNVPANLLKALTPGLAIKGEYGSLTLKSDGSYTYLVDSKSDSYIALGKDATAVDSFTYEISDGRGGVDRATINVRVKGINDNPVAQNDGSTSYEFGEANQSGNVLLNDTDIDQGDTLVVTKIGVGLEVSKLVTNNVNLIPATVVGKYGSLSINASGEYTYEVNKNDPDFLALTPGATYAEIFSYEASDGKGGVSRAQLTVALNGPKEPTDGNGLTNKLYLNGVLFTETEINGYHGEQKIQLAGPAWSGLFDSDKIVELDYDLITIEGDPFAMYLDDDDNEDTDTELGPDDLGDLNLVAELLNEILEFSEDRADVDALIVIEAADESGKFGVYAFNSAANGVAVTASELALIVVVNSASPSSFENPSLFINTISEYTGT